ncbi:Cytochrome c oxidase assembly factor like [Actinidia chinensis var. chinensis]|uniref:Cytochrome c oxidase assembly factor like n=1 Tax=Actinidia chinensis var. chinensis TaxID=1590841 RepID=A0A2R6P4I5_ACTCC|nr:Cytochrome c oxidase assembly factor like [Actinidia chinensis var. chinensis]
MLITLKSNMDLRPNPNAAPPPRPVPSPPLHQSDADEEDESVKQLQECSSLYLSLQDCLVNTNRNWKSCQMEVQALKACHERRKNDKKK